MTVLQNTRHVYTSTTHTFTRKKTISLPPSPRPQQELQGSITIKPRESCHPSSHSPPPKQEVGINTRPNPASPPRDLHSICYPATSLIVNIRYIRKLLWPCFVNVSFVYDQSDVFYVCTGEVTNQSIYQSINQSIKQTINQSTNQSI